MASAGHCSQLSFIHERFIGIYVGLPIVLFSLVHKNMKTKLDIYVFSLVNSMERRKDTILLQVRPEKTVEEYPCKSNPKAAL